MTNNKLLYFVSLKDLHLLVKNTPEYKRRNPKEQFLLIDNCNFIIHLIITNQREVWSLADKEPIEIYYKAFENQIGKRIYKKPIDLLKSLEIITVNDSYLTEKEANRLTLVSGKNVSPKFKEYGLTDKAKLMGKVDAGVLSEQSKRVFLKNLEQYYSALEKSPVVKRILRHISKLQFTGITYDSLAMRDKEHEYLVKSIEDLERFNDLSNSAIKKDSHFYALRSSFGRFYYYHCTIPKELRQGLIHSDNSKLYEIDLKQAQPLIIALMYVESSGDMETLKYFINGADWYKMLSDKAMELGFKDLSFNTPEERGQFKKRIIANAFYSRATKTKELDLLKAVYPEFTKWIINYKKEKGFKALSQDAQTIESSIFIDGFFSEVKSFAIPIHDAIYCKKKDVKNNRKVLSELLHKRFSFVSGEEFNNLFTVKKMEKKKETFTRVTDARTGKREFFNDKDPKENFTVDKLGNEYDYKGNFTRNVVTGLNIPEF